LVTFPEQSLSSGSNATFNLWTGMFGMAFLQQLWTLLFADDEGTLSNTDCKLQRAAYKLHQIKSRTWFNYIYTESRQVMT
jgi:hypothetical protein